MYDELIKRLRDAAKMSEALAVLLPHSEGNATAKLYNEAADAIEELSKKLFYAELSEAHTLEIQKALLDSVKIPRWVPVEERLPEEAGKYLVCGQWRGKQTEIWVCEFMTLGYLKGLANNAVNPPVTHWMNLPEPPKEE